MNLRSVDLNLLVILDALLEEAHVTRAAERLGLSQPATSAALQRCRHLFGDDLLERGRDMMRLTPRAEKLRDPLKLLLDNVVDLIDPAEVPVSEIQATIRITMADYPALFVAVPLQQALQKTAPGISLVIQPWYGAENTQAALTGGTTDLAVSVFDDGDLDIHCEKLLDEHYTIAMRRAHPAVDAFDLDSWLAFPHILVSARGEATSPLDVTLKTMGRSRRVGLVVPSFGMVPDLLRGSDMIAMLPSRVARIFAKDLATVPTPLPVEGFPLHLAWHRRQTKNVSLRHVADEMTDLLTNLAPPTAPDP